jgi:hypothetical protein
MSNANTCVVCSRGSTRVLWTNTINAVDGNGFVTTFVACDFHTLNDIEATIMANGFNPVTGPGDINQPISIDESPAS